MNVKFIKGDWVRLPMADGKWPMVDGGWQLAKFGDVLPAVTRAGTSPRDIPALGHTGVVQKLR